MVLVLTMAVLFFLAIGGVAYAMTGNQAARTQKRMTAVTRAQLSGAAAAGRGAPDANQQRRKNVSALLKDLEKQQQANKVKPTLRKRLDQAGLAMDERSFHMLSIICALVALGVGMIFKLSLLVIVLLVIPAGLGLPRWTLSFLKARREKAFTSEFANAIDIVVRSVKSGLPTNEALKIVAREMPQPVSGEFERLVESMKVGVSLDQACRRMYERIPTPEVNFFGIVMTIQSKTGGNLSEALGNLSHVLRDRKRLQGKIKAMSSEAKASAAIIGSLPPGVMVMVWLSTPAYIDPLFSTRMGNLLLFGCAIWMATGIFVMKKMISFKH